MQYDLTIVTPVLNGEKTLSRTIDSIMLQDNLKIQYLIMDGGSSDNSVEIAKKYIGRNPNIDIIVKSQKDNNMYSAINNGFQEAEGEFICYINSDDFFIPHSLDSAVRNFRKMPKVGVLFHDSLVEKNGWIFKNVPQPKYLISARIKLGHILFQEGVIIRKKNFELVGQAPEKYSLAGDFALWVALLRVSKFKKGNGEIAVFSIREGQLSEAYDVYRDQMKLIAKDYFQIRSHHLLKIWDNLGRLIQHWIYKWNLKHDDSYYFGDYSRAITKIPFKVKDFVKPRNIIFENQTYRFLFSTVDNRFGNNEANYWFLDDLNKVATATPDFQLAKLQNLYENHYSTVGVRESNPEEISPYKYFRSHLRLRSIIYRSSLDKFTRFINPNVWGDQSLEVFLKHLPEKYKENKVKEVDFLEIGCFEGDFLSLLRDKFDWSLNGVELNEVAAKIAREKGFQVYSSSAEKLSIHAAGIKFDLIYFGQVFEHFDNPIEVLKKFQEMLKPGGVIIFTTPNLQSLQRKMFGPTWAHWHAPYHRHIFSPSAIRKLAGQCDLNVRKLTSHSHAYWTGLSVALNNRGIGGFVSHFSSLDPLTCSRAQKIALTSNLFWDPILKGDYLAVSLQKE